MLALEKPKETIDQKKKQPWWFFFWPSRQNGLGADLGFAIVSQKNPCKQTLAPPLVIQIC